MASGGVLLVVAAMLIQGIKGQESLITDLVAAQDFLDNYNAMAERVYSASTEAAWTYNTNITEHNQQVMLDARLASSRFSQEAAENASRFDLQAMTDPQMIREFIKIMDIGTSAQTDEAKLIRLSEVESELETIYSTAKACLSPSECLPLDPDLTRLLTKSRDYNRLLSAWKGWRDATGPKMKELYTEFVSLSNEAVAILGHADTGAYWRSWYDTPEFESDVRALFDQLRPLYEHLHAFVRRRLKQIYGADKFPASGHIPAHLLGNMWAQQWTSLMDEVMPYAGRQSLDVTPEMVRQGYTPVRIFQTADDFFGSLGMIRMPEAFWNKSMLAKPSDGRDVICHASAWDFYNRVDFRVKQCTDITQDHLETAHHEMGHIEYYLQYKDQPVSFRGGANPESSSVRTLPRTIWKLLTTRWATSSTTCSTSTNLSHSGVVPIRSFWLRQNFRITQCTDLTQTDLIITHHEMGHVQYYIHYRNLPVVFRNGANPGFHEAVGDVISLSVQTPEHMQSIGLLQSVSNDTETDINFLMSMALQKIAFLPFGYLIDQWRWSVFRGETTPDKYNEQWWNLRCRYQGVSPPVERTSADFDPGAKFHIPANTPYIRYFVSFVIQFQFHKALCDKAGYTGPLHRCDIYNSKDAGTALSNMLSLGSSRPWTEAMQMLTGQPKMDAQPLVDYFQPLLEFLRNENGNDYGWHPHCSDMTSDNDGDSDRGGNSGSQVVVSLATFTTMLLLHILF